MNVLGSRYWKEAGIELDYVNTSAGDRVRLPEARRTAADILRGLRILAQVKWKLPRARLVLLWANSGFICSLGVLIMMISSVFRKPLIVKVFGAYLAERISRLGPARRSLTVSMLKKARFILPQTRSLAGSLAEETHLPPERISPFPNFIPDAMMPPELNKRRFSGRFVFVGQVKREKGVFEIIKALQGRKGWSCDFYGPVVERDREEFAAAVSGSGNCRYSGLIDPGGVVETIAAYDLLLLPTRHIGEGYPAVILQAFAGGTPVVSTEWRSIPEIIDDGRTGLLVKAQSPDELVRAIERFESDEALYASVAAEAFEKAKEFSEKSVVKGILLEKVVGIVSG